MTNEEMVKAYELRSRVKVVNHDYEFEGQVIVLFHKIKHPEKHIKGDARIRCVIENDGALCLIQSAKNLELVMP